MLIVLQSTMLVVLGAGLEPAWPKPRDFKSLVSTNFTTRAFDVDRRGINKQAACLNTIKKGKYPLFQLGRRPLKEQALPSWAGQMHTIEYEGLLMREIRHKSNNLLLFLNAEWHTSYS